MVIFQLGCGNLCVVCPPTNGVMRTRLVNLPAFLCGVAAMHFHVLTNTQKDSYDHLFENLKDALCPAVCKMFYVDFTTCLLHDKEDPAVYSHSLRELLDKAAPTLSAAAKKSPPCSSVFDWSSCDHEAQALGAQPHTQAG